MIYNNINDLIEKNRVFFNFSEISKIPRATFSEKKISDFIKAWAENLNLEVHQDSKNNLLIRKKATLGYENKKPIILQAHIDMVCEKAPDSNHDFQNDPIDLVLDGDILSTGNKTTLGADDGIGVALAMTILEDKNLKHPGIDAIFTTAEEEDMSGALSLDASWFYTNRIINLDNMIDNELVVGSCGGKGAELKYPLELEDIKTDSICFYIKLANLAGGHSGEDINKGRTNAIVLLGRLLNKFRNDFDFSIFDIKGGNFRLAIPREASVSLTINKNDIDVFKKSLSDFENNIKNILVEEDKNFSITINNLDLKNTENKIFTKGFRNKIIDNILLSPNGAANMLSSLAVVESSCNLGELFIKDNFIFFVTEIRATYEANREFIYEKIESLAKIFSGEVRDFYHYPSWIYRANSELQKNATKIYKDLYNEDMKIIAVHAGLECSCFEDKVKDMDAISIGPNAWDLHSPKERLSVSSTEKIYRFLVALLENLD